MYLVRSTAEPEWLLDFRLFKKLMLFVVTRPSHVVQPEGRRKSLGEPVYHDIGDNLVICWVSIGRRPAEDFLSDVDEARYWRSCEYSAESVRSGLVQVTLVLPSSVLGKTDSSRPEFLDTPSLCV